MRGVSGAAPHSRERNEDAFGDVCSAPLEIADELRPIPARTYAGLRAKAAALLGSETYEFDGKKGGCWGEDDSVYAALASIVGDIENLPSIQGSPGGE